jgi:hypothetical protein
MSYIQLMSYRQRYVSEIGKIPLFGGRYSFRLSVDVLQGFDKHKVPETESELDSKAGRNCTYAPDIVHRILTY